MSTIAVIPGQHEEHEVRRLRHGATVQVAKHRPPGRAQRGERRTRLALSPYLIEDVTFTLEEIRRARDAA